jgi:YVTN family beta-propeller protein
MKLFELKLRLIALLIVVCSLASVGSQPAQAQGPFAYVTNQSDNTVSVIDTSTNTVVTTIPIGGCPGTCPSPAGLAVTPDGSRVYVANHGNGTVSVIATSANTVSATITIPPCDCASSSPTGVAITPDGTRAYVTDTSRSAIEVIDTNPASGTYNTVTFTITADVSSPVGPIAITPDGTAAFYTFGTGSVGRIDTTTNNHTTTITVGSNPTGIAVTPNNAFIYVTNNGGTTVSVIPNTFPTFSPVTPVTVGSRPYSVAITPNGLFAYVVNQGSNSVSVINTTTQFVVATVPPTCIFTNQIAITPDGTHAYVADNECSQADVISTASNTVTANVPVGNGPFGVAIGPTGTETQTKTLGGPGTTTTFTFNTDTYKITGVNNQGGEQLTVAAFLVPASTFPAGFLPSFPNERCIPYGDYSASLGHDTCVEFQTQCQLSATDATPCDFIYLLATGYDLPADLSEGIGGPDFLVAHRQPCPLTSTSTVQSIFLSYEATIKDPTTHGGSRGPSCFGATYTPGAPIITGTTSRFDGWESPVSNIDLNQVKAGSVRKLKFQLFDNLGNPVTNLSLCNSFSFSPATGNVCNDPEVHRPWVNLSSFGIACPDGTPRSPDTDEAALSSADNSGLLNHGHGNYVFRWKTEKDWKGLCANVTATFDSGLMVVPAMKGFHFKSDGGDEE